MPYWNATAPASFCDGPGERLPTPTTPEQVQCIAGLELPIDHSYALILTGYERKEIFQTADGSVTAPSDLVESSGGFSYYSPMCVESSENIGTLVPHCGDSAPYLACEVVPEGY